VFSTALSLDNTASHSCGGEARGGLPNSNRLHVCGIGLGPICQADALKPG
jgi:hypothetical protein